MKQLFTLLFAVAIAQYSSAQNASAVVFSENGEKFTLLLNGEKQNNSPLVNVKLKGLTSEFYQARVDFEDATLADFTSNTFAVKFGYEATYIIRKNKKGEYVLRWTQETAIGAEANIPSVDPIKEYAIADDMVEEEPLSPPPAPASPAVKNTVPAVNQNVTVTETTKTTTKPAASGNTSGVNVNMNVEGFNMGLNMQVTDPTLSEETESHTTVTTTTTTTKTTTAPAPAPVVKPAPKPSLTPAPAAPRPREEVVVAEATGKGCMRAMDAGTFGSAKKSISDKGFDDTRLTVAKQVAKANCLSVAQIIEICKIFAFEESKLDFAKFAHDHCFDPSNYFMVGDVFAFSSSVEELTNHIESK
jgi:hypothetical protein